MSKERSQNSGLGSLVVSPDKHFVGNLVNKSSER